jgi:hypothetical protein
MKLTSIALTLALGLSIALSSCSKEKQLENRLEGSWNLTHYSRSDGTTTVTYDNVTGTYQFKHGGTGSYSIAATYGVPPVQLTFSDQGNFTWSNTDDQVTLNYTSGDFDDGSPYIYTVETDEWNKQVWARQESGVNGDVERVTLTKK